MTRRRVTLGTVLAAALGLAAARSANAASLQQVSNWGVSGLPSDVTMYIYVPNKVATNPPILTLIHYCGGTASPSSARRRGAASSAPPISTASSSSSPAAGAAGTSQSNKTWTRDGGGDSHAIRQMVTYAISQYKGERGSRLRDGRLVRRHDDGAPARALSRRLQGRLRLRGHAGRCRGSERIGQRRRLQRRVRGRLGHAHRAAMGRHRAHAGPGVRRTPPARAAVSRRRRHDHQLHEPHRGHQGMDQRPRA